MELNRPSCPLSHPTTWVSRLLGATQVGFAWVGEAHHPTFAISRSHAPVTHFTDNGAQICTLAA